jgi:hypothetical protein
MSNSDARGTRCNAGAILASTSHSRVRQKFEVMVAPCLSLQRGVFQFGSYRMLKLGLGYCDGSTLFKALSVQAHPQFAGAFSVHTGTLEQQEIGSAAHQYDRDAGNRKQAQNLAPNANPSICGIHSLCVVIRRKLSVATSRLIPCINCPGPPPIPRGRNHNVTAI